MADLRPADSWFEEELHFFVFQLRPVEGATLPEAPVAVFAMHPESDEPLSAVVVTPSADGAEAEVTDLRQPESTYTAPLSA